MLEQEIATIENLGGSRVIIATIEKLRAKASENSEVRDMFDGMTDKHFDALGAYLYESLAELKVDPNMIEKIMLLIEDTRNKNQNNQTID